MTKKFHKFETGANKDKANKLRLDLVTPEMIEALGEVLSYGATKYADRNWEKGIPFMDSIAASQRHLMQFLKGNNLDEESGLYHIEQAFLNLGMVVTQHRRRRTDLDNRYKPIKFTDESTESYAKWTIEGTGGGGVGRVEDDLLEQEIKFFSKVKDTMKKLDKEKRDWDNTTADGLHDYVVDDLPGYVHVLEEEDECGVYSKCEGIDELDAFLATERRIEHREARAKEKIREELELDKDQHNIDEYKRKEQLLEDAGYVFHVYTMGYINSKTHNFISDKFVIATTAANLERIIRADLDRYIRDSSSTHDLADYLHSLDKRNK